MSLSLSRCLSTWYRVLNNYLSLHHVASPSDHSRRFYSRSSRLSSLARSRLPRRTSVVDVAGVEGYHRVLYHISYYNTACYNSCRRGFYWFCAFFFVVMRQPTTTDTCMCVCSLSVFFITRGQGITRVPTCPLYIFFSRVLVQTVSLSKIRARIRSAIHGL